MMHIEGMRGSSAVGQNNQISSSQNDKAMPLFSDISSEEFLAQRSDWTIRLKIGNDGSDDLSVNIPRPDKKDLKAAAATQKMTTKKRQDLIYWAAQKNRLWLTAYLCAAYNEKEAQGENARNWFDPDHKYAPVLSFAGERSLLSMACYEASPHTVALLLQCKEININNGSGEGKYNLPLWAALNCPKLENGQTIVKLLCRYRELHIDSDDLNKAATQSLRELLKHTQERNKDFRPSAPERKALTASSNNDDREAVSFSVLSSEELLAQDSVRPVRFTLGDDKKSWVFDIPAPTASDLKTAAAAHKMTPHKRQKLIRKITRQQKTWLAAYMHTVRRERDNDNTWFDPSFQYFFEFAQSSWLPALSLREGNTAIAAISLHCPDTSLNNFNLFSNNRPLYNPLLAAVTHPDEKHSKTVVEMMCCFHRLHIEDFHMSNARTKDMRDFLQLTQIRNTELQGQNNTAETNTDTKHKPQKKALAASQESETAPATDGAVWEKIDEATIAKTALSAGGEHRLRRIFNFKSGTFSEVHEYLGADGRIQAATAQNLLAFNRLGSRKEVEEAQAQLRRMNGLARQ
ncbi:MAG: hypothetical protein EA357_06590 [Micavibrio sp.]|nr:MAG: hypothetical protein EA357_06590 [Micavibrio sp.]